MRTKNITHEERFEGALPRLVELRLWGNVIVRLSSSKVPNPACRGVKYFARKLPFVMCNKVPEAITKMNFLKQPIMRSWCMLLTRQLYEPRR